MALFLFSAYFLSTYLAALQIILCNVPWAQWLQLQYFLAVFSLLKEVWGRDGKGNLQANPGPCSGLIQPPCQLGGTLSSKLLPATPTPRSAPTLQPLQMELAAKQRPLPLREASLHLTPPESLLPLVQIQRRRQKDISRTEHSKVLILLAVHARPQGADGLDGDRLLSLDAAAAFRAFGPRLQGDRELKTVLGVTITLTYWEKKRVEAQIVLKFFSVE